jgi:predicted amidophosphoribosyltransferase
VVFRHTISGRVGGVIARGLSELLAVVVPPACVACRAPLARAQLRLCAECTRALPWLPAWVCSRCGLPRHRRGCPAASAAYARAWAPLAYDGVARALVAALKFRSALPVAGLMAAQIAANLPAELRGPRVLVPVPPQPARHRRRGFDPAGSLAAALALRLDLALSPCLVRRDRERPQVGATRAVRRRRGRLLVELRAPPPAAALLIDDVHTTGATLDACARVLRAGGCEEVVAVTYARTL